MMDLFRKAKIFGPLNAIMYSVEWQKRGLPHIHILLWLKDKIKAEDIDKVICAELPDPKEDKELYDIIVGHEKVDFADDTNRAEIMKLCEKVLKWIHKKLPGYSRGLDINDEKSVQSMQLQEFLDIIESRWKLGCA